MRQGCGPSSHGEDTAGSGIKSSRHGAEAQPCCPPTNPSLLPACPCWAGCPLPEVANGRGDSRGDTPRSAGWRGVRRGGKCIGGKEMPDEDSQLSARCGQTGEEPRPRTGCDPHGATSGGLPATSRATGGPAAARCDGLGGRHPHTERRSCGIFDFFSSSL